MTDREQVQDPVIAVVELCNRALDLQAEFGAAFDKMDADKQRHEAWEAENAKAELDRALIIWLEGQTHKVRESLLELLVDPTKWLLRQEPK